MNQPTLTTGRLHLEPLTWDHADAIVELDSDPEVTRHIYGRARTRTEVVDDTMPRWLERSGTERGLGLWAGYDRDSDGAFAGVWCLLSDPNTTEAAELGYRLRRDAWGRGLATEGARAMLAYGFDTLDLPVIWAETMAVNTGSRGVMRRLEMTHVHSEPADEWPWEVEGMDHGIVFYELTRDRWQQE